MIDGKTTREAMALAIMASLKGKTLFKERGADTNRDPVVSLTLMGFYDAMARTGEAFIKVADGMETAGAAMDELMEYAAGLERELSGETDDGADQGE